jgi:glycosyltransferase involved in cell wall biosynthesis
MRAQSRAGSDAARITVGLPVRNGENYVEEAIESILDQSYRDLRLIIADNASDDRTQEICRGYAARDPRVSYHRHAENIGAAQNFNWVFGQNTSMYFKWAAHDDVLGPDFLRLCVDRLDADPALSLCHTLSVRIDASRRVCGTYDQEIALEGARVRDRFRRVLWVDHFTEIWGVMRSDMLRRTRLYGSFVGSDRSLLAEMLLLGGVGYVPEYHFFRRDHDGCYCRSLHSAAERLRWFDPKKSHPVLNDAPAKFCAYVGALGKHPVPTRDRLACLRSLSYWCGQRTLQRMRVWTSGYRPALGSTGHAAVGTPPPPPARPSRRTVLASDARSGAGSHVPA